MNNIKKIVLFKNKKSEEGASWAIIRDDGYEIVSLKEGRNICLRYAAMNGITTGKMVEEKLFDKVIFYSPDFESLFRDHIVNDCFNNPDDEDYPSIVDEEKPNQFVMVEKPYTPVEISDGVNSSDSLETSDSQLFSKAKDDLNNMPVVDDDGIIESVEIGEEPTGKGEEAGEEPIVKGEEAGEEPTGKVEKLGEEPTGKGEEAGEESTGKGEKPGEEPTVKGEEAGEEPIGKGEKPGEEPTGKGEKPGEEPIGKGEKPGEEPTGKGEEAGEEPTGKGEKPGEKPTGKGEKPGEEPTGKGEEAGEEPTGKGEKPGEEPTGKGEKPGEEPTVKVEEAEESIDEGDIGIIDRIKNFGNGVLNQLKKYAFFETIVGMVVVGIVTIFGVKYSLNRDKDDIYVNHHSNTEEFADDEDLYTSPLAKFINKIFPTNEYNESEEIQYIPYTSESDNNSDFSEFSTDNSGEVDLVEYTDDTDFVETTDDTDFVETTDDTDFVETTDDTDFVETTDDTDFVETTDDTDFVETTDDTDFVETTDDTDFVETTDDTDFVETTDDTDFYDITIDSNSEDAVLVNDEKLFDEIEYDNGYNSDYTSNITFDPSGDQTDLTLPDPNASSAYSAFIDSYFRILESSGDVSESGKQYVKTA